MLKVQPSKTMVPVLEQARELVTDPRLATVLAIAVATPSLWVGQREGARRFLIEHGIEVPPELDVRFTQEDPLRATTGAAPVTIRLVNSQTYWVAKEDGTGYEQVTWCRGFEIVPRGEGSR